MDDSFDPFLRNQCPTRDWSPQSPTMSDAPGVTAQSAGMHTHDRLEVLLIHFTDALDRKALFCPFRNAKRHVISEQTIGAKRAGRHAVVARCATSPASALAIAG